MAGLVNASRNTMLDAFGSAYGFVSLHTADPGTTGTSEVTGGSPAYARKAVTWAAAATSSKSSSSQVVFDVPGSTTIAYLGYWTAATGGTFGGSRPLDVNQTFATQGTYTMAAGSITENLT
ncbi:MAG: phage tail fiber protein [Mycobacteriaceae bacterium]